MVTQLELPEEMARRLDALALHEGQSREDLMRAVLADYLARMAEDEADAEIEAQLLARDVTPEQLAAVRAEVFAEEGVHLT